MYASLNSSQSTIVSSLIAVDLITSIAMHSYTGRAIDEYNPGGIYIVETPKIIFLATYENTRNNGYAGQAIPHLVKFAREISELKY